MPKRKATAKLSGLIGSDDDDLMNVNGTGNSSNAPLQSDNDTNERPTKRPRGRPRSKSVETKAENNNMPTKTRSTTTAAPPAAASKKPTKRGRPRSSGNSQISADATAQEGTEATVDETADDLMADTQEAAAPVSGDELDAPVKAKATKQAKKPAANRGRKGAAAAKKAVQTDGEFEYTPTSSRQTKATEKNKEKTEQPTRKGRRKAPAQAQAESEADGENTDGERTAPDVVDETIMEDAGPPRSVSASPSKTARNRVSMHRSSLSPQKRKLGDDDKPTGEPELRRRLGDMTKKYDSLENRYRNLKEIGIVEASANMNKLQKQCEAMTEASNNLISSLKAELEAQKALGQQSRSLQKQLKERDAEAARLKQEADDATAQLTSTQSEVKTLQTKLAAARNTAASLESAATKVPGSAIKNNGANRAQAAEAAHAAQFAQLKEDLYSDLTGLIIRDVKKRETDHLYDCIQTGINGTLHFKLSVPQVSSSNFESAEFQYVPLLDENRDRDLVDILPDYLTVDITFSRQQASKFYTRVIDTLTKRRGVSNA